MAYPYIQDFNYSPYTISKTTNTGYPVVTTKDNNINGVKSNY